jgi:hypothetical protein
MCHITDFGPFGSFRSTQHVIHKILSRSLKRSRETISELGKFHHGFAPEMVNFRGEGRTSMKERVKSWGKGDEKHGKP